MPEGCQLRSKIFFNLEILTVYIVNEIFCKAEIKLRIFSSAYHFGGIVTVVVLHIHAQIVFAFRRYALRRQKRLDGIIVPFLTVWAHTLDYLPRLFGSYPICYLFEAIHCFSVHLRQTVLYRVHHIRERIDIHSMARMGDAYYSAIEKICL